MIGEYFGNGGHSLTEFSYRQVEYKYILLLNWIY